MASTPLSKRPRNAEPERFEDLNCVAECPDAILQGVVTVGEMLAARTGTPYFHGSIEDGKKNLRVYGFDASIREQLAEASGRAVILKHCEVKRQTTERGGGLQVRHVTRLNFC